VTITEETKACPFCAETIKRDAVICRFCNYDLRSSTPTTMVVQAPQHVPPEVQPVPVVQARSGIMDGVKIGTGMFVVLPLLCILGLLLMCSIGGSIH
jgi:hypothetical protein